MLVGNCEIEVISVTHKRTNQEDGGQWITGEAKIEWSFERGSQIIRRYATVYVGCWDNMAFADQCDSLGAEICQMLRDAAVVTSALA